jgi:decaprenylphospho-beta-D-ribofuranose 2-oxidase
VDLDRGLAVVEPGVSLQQLMQAMLPFGYFVPVTPGTRYVTVGGAIASDIHGKSHHADGSFAQHVVSLDLLLADGTVRTLTPQTEPELFWATVGGMGLTGVVLSGHHADDAGGDLPDHGRDPAGGRPRRGHGADDRDRRELPLLRRLAGQPGHRREPRPRLGGERQLRHPDQLPPKLRATPLAFSPKPLAKVPDLFPSGLLNRRTIRLMNEANFRRAPKGAPAPGHHRRVLPPAGRDPRLEPGLRPGRVPAVPVRRPVRAPTATLRRIVERVAVQGAPSFVTVLKRFGPASPGYLSFPTDGWTLTYDFPTGTPGLSRLLRWLDEQVLAAGGRLYLAKDSRMDPGDVAAMYPRLEAFRKVRGRGRPARGLRLGPVPPTQPLRALFSFKGT